MNIKTKSFSELFVWQEAHSLTLQIYKISQEFPAEEMFGLTSQLRRSASSITNNIAEGYGRAGKKDKQRFYNMSMGSIRELQNQSILARDLQYIRADQFSDINNRALEIAKMLSKYIKKLY